MKLFLITFFDEVAESETVKGLPTKKR